MREKNYGNRFSSVSLRPEGSKRRLSSSRVSMTVTALLVCFFVLVAGVNVVYAGEKSMNLPNGVRMMKLSYTNIFFIPCSGGYLQIDTSYPVYYEEYLKKLKKLDIEPSQIKYLLLTHHHDDHSGFVVDLLKNNPETILILHKNGLEGLSNGASVEDSRPVNKCVKIIVADIFGRFHKFVFPPYTLSTSDIILDGENDSLLPSIGIDGTIIYTPGHSNDSISVILSDGSAFVGDIAMDFLNICNCRHLPIYIADLEEVYISWDKIKRHGAKTIYTSHGKPFSVEELNRVE